MVSVVIPCYNQARFLGEAIESVLAQTRGPAEIIVVDDGSTEDLRAVTAAYAGVRYLRQANQGQGAARNHGLQHATGEYVVFLDSDDRLLPHAFEVGLGGLDANPACALAAGRCIVFGPDGVNPYMKYQPVVERDHYLALLRNNYIWMPGTAVFRTAAVRGAGGFRTNVTGAEDYDLYLRIARTHPIWCHGEMVAEYRQHDSSTSRRPMLMLRSTLAVAYSQRRFVKGNREAERAWRQGLRFWKHEYGEQVVSALRMQLRNGRWRDAAAALFALMRYHPRGFLYHVRKKLYRLALGYKPEASDAIG